MEHLTISISGGLCDTEAQRHILNKWKEWFEIALNGLQSQGRPAMRDRNQLTKFHFRCDSNPCQLVGVW